VFGAVAPVTIYGSTRTIAFAHEKESTPIATTIFLRSVIERNVAFKTGSICLSEINTILIGAPAITTLAIAFYPSHIIKRVQIDLLEDGYWMRAGDTVQELIREELWLLQAVKYEVVMGLIEARADLLWFHAGAVANSQGAILLAGVGGSGKSTLVSYFCQHGWQYLSDDVIALDLQTGTIRPFPQTPRVRQAIGELVSSDRLGEVPKQEVFLNPDQVCRDAVPVQVMVFVQHDPDIAAQVASCTPGTAAIELLRHCINFADHKQTAMQRISKLVAQAQSIQLTFSSIEAAISSLNIH